jgi:hypothetical protein
MFILLFLLGYRRIRIRTSYYWIRIQEAQKHTDPAAPDPDPQQCATRTTKIRIWILLFPSVALNTPTKTMVPTVGTIHLHQSSKITSH